MKSGLFFMSALVVTVLVFSSFLTAPQNDPWIVPEKFKKMENPVAADKESINIGKVLYSKHCKSCHGKEGLGDGPKAAQLDTPAGDFTTEEFQAQTDGAIFYKTKEGRGDMPTFGKKIPYDEDIWHLVNYLRTLE
jgi:mono/diheme cytochrome c family protein